VSESNYTTQSRVLSAKQMAEVYQRATEEEKKLVFGENWEQILKDLSKKYAKEGLDTTLEGQAKFAQLFANQQKGTNRYANSIL
jgi:hypothetical protein